MTSLDRWMTRALLVSTAYNAAGAVSFVFPSLTPFFAGLPLAGHPLYTAIAAFTIALFGAGYLWQALSGQRDRTFLTLASVGKVSFFLLFFMYWIEGSVPLLVMLSTSGDLVLGSFFAYWLWSTRRRPVLG